MATASQVMDAESAAKAQRFACLPLLRVNEKIASPADLALYGRIKGIQDADALDKFLSQQAVNDLFCRRVLFYGDSEP